MAGVLALFVLHVLGSLRRASSHKLLHVPVLGAYTLSYTLVSYTLGLMQASHFYFVEFPVWAVCLLMLLGGTDNLMACNLNDEAVPEYVKPLWGILLVNVLQACVRIKSMRMASKSNLLARNVKPIVDHMKREEDEVPPGELPDPVTMKGYRYVVGGEHRPKNYVNWLKHATRYNKIEEKRSIITVEQIWGCKGSLLHPRSGRGLRLKDVCLSMALSKMLNRRFAGCELNEARLQKTHDFVFGGLLTGDKPYERAFRVIVVELGFVYDLYYTRYPYLYRKIRYFALCLPVAMVTLCSWLTYNLFKKHKEHNNSKDTSLSTTLFLMAVVTFLEVFQLYLHMASDWFKVALIRSYVTRHALGRSDCLSDAIISLLLRLKRFGVWEDKLGQYSFLNSYNATRRISYCVHYVTLCLLDKDKKGRKRGKLVKLSTHVKKAVIDSLIRSKGQLQNGVMAPQNHTQLPLACSLRDVTVAHTILVWHIATTICKHQLDAATAKCDKKIPALSAEDSSAVDTASSLSQYCAYLVAFAPDLLPDHSFDSAYELDNAIEEARNFPPLKDAKTMEKKCDALMSYIDTNSDDAPILVIKGAQLAKELMDIQNRWKVLSDFWAEMMLYIAPCCDAQARAHLEALPRGGEFITHLWALLTHAGVLKRDPSPPTVSPDV
ncbi:unnamed protein product [Alopecurus aequalis]